jgi:hypothetical protein
MNIRPIAVVLAAAFLNCCVHSPANVATELAAADNKCTVRRFDSAAAKVDCLSRVESPVIQKDMPFAINSYWNFQAKRLRAATEFDRDTAPVQAAWKRFHNETQQAAAVLAEREPNFADGNATLRKELNKASIEGVCPQTQLIGRMNCFNEIMRPIWERHANNTLAYYDAFHAKRMQFARDYDAVSAQFAAPSAVERYNGRIRQALADFLINVSDERKAAEQQAAERRAEAQARTAEAANRLADFIDNLAVATLGAVAVVATARAEGDAAALRALNASRSLGGFSTTPSGSVDLRNRDIDQLLGSGPTTETTVSSRPNPIGGFDFSNGISSRPNPLGGYDYSDGRSCRPNPLGGTDCR